MSDELKAAFESCMYGVDIDPSHGPLSFRRLDGDRRYESLTTEAAFRAFKAGHAAARTAEPVDTGKLWSLFRSALTDGHDMWVTADDEGMHHEMASALKDAKASEYADKAAALFTAPAEPVSDEPVARVLGYFNGRCVIEPIDRLLVIQTGAVLSYHRPAPVALSDEQIMDIAEPFGEFAYGDAQGAKGVMDGTAKIAQKYGVTGPASYALADEVFDLIKHLVQRHAKASAEDVK